MLHSVWTNQTFFFPTARHHSVTTPWHHGLPKTIRSGVKAHFAAWKAFWAVLFLSKWENAPQFCPNCCSIETNQQQTFLSHPSRSFLSLFFWHVLRFLKAVCSLHFSLCQLKGFWLVPQYPEQLKTNEIGALISKAVTFQCSSTFKLALVGSNFK